MSPNERRPPCLAAPGLVVVVTATLTVLVAPVGRVSADGAAEFREPARGPLGAVADVGDVKLIT